MVAASCLSSFGCLFDANTINGCDLGVLLDAFSMQNTNGGTTTFAASKENEGHGSWTPIGFKGQHNTPENDNKQTFAGAFNYMRTDSKKFSSDARHIEEH